MKSDPLFSTARLRMMHSLPRQISAIPLFHDVAGRVQLGTIVQLPAGAEVELCGDGFDRRTVKVQWGGGFYYVFAEDIEQRSAHLAGLAAAG